MDLPNPVDEASKKLIGTMMFVNGKLKQVDKFLFDLDAVAVFDYDKDTTVAEVVKTLEVYLPEAGAYAHPDGYYVVLNKIPKRQWLRSFHSSFYNVQIVGERLTSNEIMAGIADKKKVNVFVSFDKYIYYWSNTIGYVKNSSTLVCTNPAFKQEIIDWDRNDNK
jgi:hypothetical protein